MSFETKDVVSARGIIIHNGKFLALRRDMQRERNGGQWEGPGGSVEDTDMAGYQEIGRPVLKRALLREAFQEANITLGHIGVFNNVRENIETDEKGNVTNYKCEIAVASPLSFAVDLRRNIPAGETPDHDEWCWADLYHPQLDLTEETESGLVIAREILERGPLPQF
ncbi:MAG: hypothetical protein JWO47_597 [Candidatus Saccharibacteria bacterium]|nr:hypothetical protein [Candidatus Saccharibacteria bacterium]